METRILKINLEKELRDDCGTIIEIEKIGDDFVDYIVKAEDEDENDEKKRIKHLGKYDFKVIGDYLYIKGMKVQKSHLCDIQNIEKIDMVFEFETTPNYRGNCEKAENEAFQNLK